MILIYQYMQISIEWLGFIKYFQLIIYHCHLFYDIELSLDSIIALVNQPFSLFTYEGICK